MTDGNSSSFTRRQITLTASGAVVTIIAPSFADVATAATSSGNVEMTTTSTQPGGTSISARIYEDTTGDGSPNNQQEQTISAGSGVVTEYPSLEGVEGQGYVYWIEIIMTTSDTSSTPELDSATITLPEGEMTSTATAEPTATQEPVQSGPQTIDEMWDNYLLYVAALIGTFTGIGLASKSLAIGALAGYITFAYIALETGTPLFRQILYTTLVLVFLGFGFKLWRLEFGGED